MYSFIGVNFQRDEILQEPGEDATCLYFLQDGVIEIFTTFEGNEFILEKLFRGSIVNYRTFFMEQEGTVWYRFGRSSICFTLTIDKMNELCGKHKMLNKKFMAFKKKTYVQSKPFPLDYIMELPRHLREEIKDREYFDKALRLENTLKNVTIRRIVEIRIHKAKPSLKDMIDTYLKKKAEKDERARKRIKAQVLEIYEQKNFE